MLCFWDAISPPSRQICRQPATVNTVDVFWEIGAAIQSYTFHTSFGSQMSADGVDKLILEDNVMKSILSVAKCSVISNSLRWSVKQAAVNFSLLSLNRLDSCYFIYRVQSAKSNCFFSEGSECRVSQGGLRKPSHQRCERWGQMLCCLWWWGHFDGFDLISASQQDSRSQQVINICLG